MEPLQEAEELAPTQLVPDDEKLRELILHIASMCEGDPTYGAVKLNKILFFADFLAYVQLGRPITGQEYQELAHGPAPRHLVPIRDQLVETGDLVVRKRDFHGKVQNQAIALRAPDLHAFTAEEIAIVDRVIKEWWGRTAAEMSRASHQFVGWQLARPGETIPYETALFEPHEPTGEEIRHAAELEAVARDTLADPSG